MTATLILSASVILILAQDGSLTADQARAHIGETATVEGRVSVKKTAAGETYLDIGGSGSADAPFSAYVSRGNSGNFQDVEKLDGQKVQITGQISTFRGKPEIFLTDPTQLKVKADPPAPVPKQQ
jgi:DNA/RNA endonuclease YhcR with UshA esterase domain